MQVYVTPDHDTTMIDSDIVIIDTDLGEFFEPIDVEIYDHLSGDDYADAMMKELGM